MKLIYKKMEVGGHSTNYPDMTNKPKLNGKELVGDVTTEATGITWYGTQVQYDALAIKNPSTLYIIDDGSSVTTGQNYLDLNNKPSINGQILTGNKTAGDLNMYTIAQIDNMIASMKSIKVVSALPATPVPGTMYYVGPDLSGYYHVYLYDSLGNQIDLGTTNTSVYSSDNGIDIDVNNVITLKNDANTIIVNSEGKVVAAEMVGATGVSDGNKGIVPKPMAGDENKVLAGNGTWFDLFDAMYPIGSYAFGVHPTLGTWTEVTGDKALWIKSGTADGTDIAQELPKPTVASEGAGKHKHSRGTMNIIGLLRFWYDNYHSDLSGAFVQNDPGTQGTGLALSGKVGKYSMLFDASRNWTGETSEVDDHTHTITVADDTIYKASALKVQPDAVVLTVWKRTA